MNAASFEAVHVSKYAVGCFRLTADIRWLHPVRRRMREADLREHRLKTGTRHTRPVDWSHIAVATPIPERDHFVAADMAEELFNR